ncbi:hypothetical protein QFZ70_001472 [Arthrobacter sp. V1I9]|uniref:hypothetical protein n=1 Tax=Arthrobacter sp. V1I9 TaxID=3042275 RepID=UPI0027938D28|nr:hypothetical protein [Arthrobacter sp. V1I9]MDQ0868999.1 hypothetical protein [Arthrobacter sp. V1I9]
MPGAKITKIKFYSINRDVKAAVAADTYNAEEIGRKHYVSRETVNAVRRAGTWPQWLRNKAEANRKRVEKAKKLINVPSVATAIEQNGDDEEEMVTIARAQFNHFVGLERRVKKLEDWRKDHQTCRPASPQILVKEPAPKRRFWSPR